jgi:2-oxoisovalerate dehydrogenase E1 component beta subunit
MPVMTILEAIRQGLKEEMEADPRVFLLGEDIEEGGVFRATEGLSEEFGSERVMDTPLAESSIVGVAIGASLNGLVPVAEIQFADFILPAVNQIISEAAKLRYRSAGDFTCPIVIRAPYGGGGAGGLYHSQSMEALFSHIPGLKVVAPSTPYDMKGMIKSAIRDPDPVIYFEHKRTYRMIKGEVPERDYTVPIGKAEVRRKGDDLTVFSYGLALHFALAAAETVAKENGIEATVVDLRTLLPLDRETIEEDWQDPDRARRQHHRRGRRRGGGVPGAGGVRLPGRADHAHRRPGRAGGPIPSRPGGVVHAQPREDRRRDPRACSLLES